ncbi:MAG: FAD-binding protein, partial [Deltaproteobacteria bacterium]|nr:FAD-binding protein [Deltaproteobacteria bacterium]
TEEYQVAGEPWSKQNGDGEISAMAIGAALWATANQNTEGGRAISKTKHIGCRYGYVSLKWKPDSPMFHLAGASGLTVENWENVICVNQIGLRFWDELDDTYGFINAALGLNGSPTNGGGPIWAIFDQGAVEREKWKPKPPNVDPNGWFFSADTIAELANKIFNPYQKDSIPAGTLEETVAKFNSHVDAGEDREFGRTALSYKIQTPPFYAAWSTPVLHDSLTGLKINTQCQVIDMRGRPIEGLYCAGESAGGFALHGLPRCTVFGRIAGREAAQAPSSD